MEVIAVAAEGCASRPPSKSKLRTPSESSIWKLEIRDLKGKYLKRRKKRVTAGFAEREREEVKVGTK